MPRFALLLTYDGTGYEGWQCNGQNRSIEGALRSVLESLFREKVYLEAASRTDSGVHAHGQVVAFTTQQTTFSPEKLRYSINCLCPKEMCIRDCVEVPESFHPSLDCQSKTYIYTLCTGPFQSPFHRFTSWHCPGYLNVEAMESCSLLFRGTHNFRSFLSQEKTHPYENTVRNLEEFSLEHKGAQIKVRVRGQHFFYKMVRSLVGTLVQVGQGKITLSEIPHILNLGDRKLAGVTAPSHGLCLGEVRYHSPIFGHHHPYELL